MNAELRSAWFNVVVVIVALGCCLVAGVLFGMGPAVGSLGLLGLLGLTPILFHRRRGMECDERDISVAKQATLVAGISSYLFVVLGGMAVWGIQFFRGNELISVHLLPVLIVGAAIVLCFVRSVFIISQYSPNALGRHERTN